MAVAGDPQQGADPGAAGAGAVPDRPARGAAGPGVGAAQSIGRRLFLDWRACRGSWIISEERWDKKEMIYHQKVGILSREKRVEISQEKWGKWPRYTGQSCIPLPVLLFPAIAGQGKLWFLSSGSMFSINVGIEALKLSACVTLVKFMSLSLRPSPPTGTGRAQGQTAYLVAGEDSLGVQLPPKQVGSILNLGSCPLFRRKVKRFHSPPGGGGDRKCLLVFFQMNLITKIFAYLSLDLLFHI